MDEKQEKRILKRILLIIVIAIFANWLLFNYESAKSVVDYIFIIINPFVVGIIIALLLNIPMSFFEKKLQKKDKKGKIKDRKLISIILSVICIILVMLFVILLIIPELINIGNIIIENIPYYEIKVNEGLYNIKEIFPNIDINNIKENFIDNLEDLKNTLIQQIPNLLTSSIGIIAGTFMAIINFFIGVGLAFLILLDKKNVKNSTIKFIYTYMKKDRASKIINFVSSFITAFNKFVVIQCITALILGLLCIGSSLLLQIPYAFQIGILLGFSSLVPIIGVFIGIIISCILIVSVSPIKALIFIVVAIVLWQIEENFIKPKIIGKKIGLPEIWILVSMVLGISLFGFLGIFITVPIATAIFNLIKEKMSKTDIEQVENEMIDERK